MAIAGKAIDLPLAMRHLPIVAERLYEYFVQRLRSAGLIVATGQFKARMDVTLTNDGPVTFIVET